MVGPDETEVRLVELARRLTRQTESGRIAWRRTDRQGRYLYAASVGSVTIEAAQGAPETYALRVFDRGGNEAESLQVRHSLVKSASPEAYLALPELHRVAQRSAGRGAELIDDLIAEIG